MHLERGPPDPHARRVGVGGFWTSWRWTSSIALAKVNAPMAVAGKQYDGGPWPFLASCCIGPRGGLQMNEGVAVRDVEQFSWLPVVGWFGYRFYMAWEAGQGKTFSEIAAEEHLMPDDGAQARPQVAVESDPGEAGSSPSGSPH